MLDNLKDVGAPRLLFFFPAHEEAPFASCTNVEAKELDASPGDRVCMALLLEKDGPAAPFKPSYIGVSGRGILGPLRHEVRLPTAMTWRCAA